MRGRGVWLGDDVIMEDSPTWLRGWGHRGKVVSFPASYSEGPGFRSLPEDRLS
jgi:hypothetical protein